MSIFQLQHTMALKLFVSLCAGMMFVIFSPVISGGYDVWTHEQMTNAAFRSSTLIEKKHLENNLGFEKGLFEEFSGPALEGGPGQDVTKKFTVGQWIVKGSAYEDERGYELQYYKSNMRSMNHFYNPFWNSSALYPYASSVFTQAGGLYDETYLPFLPATPPFPTYLVYGSPSINWAYDGDEGGTAQSLFTRDPGNTWSWKKARVYFFQALTPLDNTQREENYAKTFRTLGHLTHLLQDAAQPEHTRNDAHPEGTQIQFGSWEPLGYEAYVWRNYWIFDALSPIDYRSLVKVGTDNPVHDFFDGARGGGFTPGESTGVAEFSAYNFLSTDTIPDNLDLSNPKDRRRYFTHPLIDQNRVQVLPGFLQDVLYYYSEGVVDPTGQQAPVSVPLAKRTWWHDPLRKVGLFSAYTENDERIWQTKAEILLPKAISYSAALINYFFRGEVEVSEIEEQRDANGAITGLKFKLKNLTPDEEMKDGEIWIAYRYKPSGDPNWKYGLSEPVTSGSMPYDSQAPYEVFFPTSGSIPADATDTQYTYVFKGTLGAEQGAVVGKVIVDYDFLIFNSREKWYFKVAPALDDVVLLDPPQNAIQKTPGVFDVRFYSAEGFIQRQACPAPPPLPKRQRTLTVDDRTGGNTNQVGTDTFHIPNVDLAPAFPYRFSDQSAGQVKPGDGNDPNCSYASSFHRQIIYDYPFLLNAATCDSKDAAYAYYTQQGQHDEQTDLTGSYTTAALSTASNTQDRYQRTIVLPNGRQIQSEGHYTSAYQSSFSGEMEVFYNPGSSNGSSSGEYPGGVGFARFQAKSPSEFVAGYFATTSKIMTMWATADEVLVGEAGYDCEPSYAYVDRKLTSDHSDVVNSYHYVLSTARFDRTIASLTFVYSKDFSIWQSSAAGTTPASIRMHLSKNKAFGVILYTVYPVKSDFPEYLTVNGVGVPVAELTNECFFEQYGFYLEKRASGNLVSHTTVLLVNLKTGEFVDITKKVPLVEKYIEGGVEKTYQEFYQVEVY